MANAILGEKGRSGPSFSPWEDSTDTRLQSAVDDEVTMILLRLHLEIMYKLSR